MSGLILCPVNHTRAHLKWLYLSHLTCGSLNKSITLQLPQVAAFDLVSVPFELPMQNGTRHLSTCHSHWLVGTGTYHSHWLVGTGAYHSHWLVGTGAYHSHWLVGTGAYHSHWLVGTGAYHSHWLVGTGAYHSHWLVGTGAYRYLHRKEVCAYSRDALDVPQIRSSNHSLFHSVGSKKTDFLVQRLIKSQTCA